MNKDSRICGVSSEKRVDRDAHCYSTWLRRCSLMPDKGEMTLMDWTRRDKLATLKIPKNLQTMSTTKRRCRDWRENQVPKINGISIHPQ